MAEGGKDKDRSTMASLFNSCPKWEEEWQKPRVVIETASRIILPKGQVGFSNKLFC